MPDFTRCVALAPATLPRLREVALDWRAYGFSAAALLAGLLFGLAPAWHATRVDVNSTMREGARGTDAHNRFRGALVAAQVAAALIPLTGAGLLIRSFYAIARVGAGFRPDHLMTMRLAPAPFKFRGRRDRQIQLVCSILRHVAAQLGVRFAITPTFFETMGMRIVRGRALLESDSPTSPGCGNQPDLADQFFPGEDPIGKRLEIAVSTPPRWRKSSAWWRM
jgi:hypothetical protein